jgi:cytochrome c-type protein NapC
MKRVGIATLVAGMLLGVLTLASFNGVMHATSSEAFCGNSCHEMGTPLASLEFFPKILRKIEASREVWGHITGLIDTPEKYAAHQPAMREREINRMRANDSQECRNCHRVERMDFDAQPRMAKRLHPKMKERGKTCIDCHDGVAHSTL